MNTHGFWNSKEARKVAPVVSRPDLVADRNATVRDDSDLRPHMRKPVRLSKAPMDNRVHFYRPDGTKYAILSPGQFDELRKRKELESWLADQRESGTIIDA